MMLLRRCLTAVSLVGGAGALALIPTTASSALPTVANQPMHHVVGNRDIGYASSNWSGYAITGTYTSVTANWAVPSVKASAGSTYSADWTGIDGFNNDDLIQTGTESDYYSGAAHYDAWWEILPASETVIPSVPVKPGNKMTATITKDSGTTWTITIKNVTTGKSFTTNQTYTGPGASAEWIVERPEVNGALATLAHYKSPEKFDPDTANSGNPGLVANDGIEMVNNSDTKVISIPSNPDSDTDGFNCSYGSVQPPPPSS